MKTILLVNICVRCFLFIPSGFDVGCLWLICYAVRFVSFLFLSQSLSFRFCAVGSFEPKPCAARSRITVDVLFKAVLLPDPRPSLSNLDLDYPWCLPKDID